MIKQSSTERYETTDGRLTPAMRDSFARDGFLVIEGFVDVDECATLIDRAGELVEGFEPRSNPAIFSTLSHSHAGDDYFEGSGDKVRFFLEEDAFDEAGRLRQPKALSVNKIGHALHDLDPVFADFSHSAKLARLTADIGVEQPLLVQSMYIFKQPEIGGEVVWHQDATFLYTEPSSVIGYWFALQDATLENGCLWALPGLHRAPLKTRFRAGPEGLHFETLDDREWPVTGRVALEVPRGTLIAMHGGLPHASSPNRSPHSRHAYSVHVVDGRYPYAADNWLQRPASMPFRGFET